MGKMNLNKQILLLSLSLLLSPPSLSAESPLVKTGGRAPGKNLKIKLSKVPQYDVTTAPGKTITSGNKKLVIKELPRLDIGEEPKVTQSESSLNLPLLPGKKPIALAGGKLPPFKLPKGFKPPSKASQSLNATTQVNAPSAQNTILPTYPEVPAAKVIETNPQAKNIKPFSEADIKLLQAMIFLELHNNYELAMGLFADLFQSPEHKNLAAFKIGQTAKALKLHSEFERRMLALIDKDQKLSRAATEELAQYMRSTDPELAAKIEPYVEKYDLSSELTGPWSISRAKGLMEDKKIEKALAIIEEIPDKNSFKPEGLYLKALILYRGNKITEAQEILEKLISPLEQNKYQYDLKSLVAMTLGRIYFQRGMYDKSFQTYLKVEKNHPLWLQSLIETAWSQILSKDFEGAAGNMFSLHTDYFKNAYQPESYLVRTVGYLNLCQYGDALAVLKQFGKKYSYVLSRVEGYQKNKKTDLDYYETVKSYLKAPEQREVEQLPRSLIVEMARSPEFLQKQRNINELEDENQRYLMVSKSLLDQEKKLQEKIASHKQKITETENKISKIKDADKKAGLESDLKFHKSQVYAFETQVAVAKRGRQSVKEVREKALAQSEMMEKDLRVKAAKVLKTQLSKVSKNITALLEQAELLQYEIYSGAGEQMRYKMAGGEDNNDTRPELKPEEKGAMRWGFKGEIWEDEVGHFRSSLKNVCPKDESKISSN